MACNRYGIDQAGPACGHGVCVGDSFCLCDAGWTSVVDFWPDPFFDCDTSIAFVQALSWIIVIENAAVLLLVLYSFSRTENLLSLKTLQKTTTRINLYWFVGSIGGLLWSIAKLADPTNGSVGYGGNNIASAGWALLLGTTFAGWATFGQLIIEFLRKSSSIFTPGGREFFLVSVAPIARWLPAFEAYALVLHPLCVVIACAVPNSGSGVLIAVNAVGCINMVVCCSACALACSSFRSNVKTILDSDGGQGGTAEIRQLYFRIGILNLFAVVFLCASTPVFIVVAASSFLRHKVMWVNMILFANTPLPEMLVLFIFAPKKAAASKSSQQKYASSKVAVTATASASDGDAAAETDGSTAAP